MLAALYKEGKYTNFLHNKQSFVLILHFQDYIQYTAQKIRGTLK